MSKRDMRCESVVLDIAVGEKSWIEMGMLYAFLAPTTVPSMTRREESSSGARIAATSRGILQITFVPNRRGCTVRLGYWQRYRLGSRFCRIDCAVHVSRGDSRPKSRSLDNIVPQLFLSLR